jgi:hypothetical protein
MTEIRWEGILRDGGVMVGEARETIETFLMHANLVCEGMSVVGYEKGHDPMRPGSVSMIAFPQQGTHVDLAIGVNDFYSSVKVRVMWHCNNSFPLPMGIPDRERIVRAARNFLYKKPSRPTEAQAPVRSRRVLATRFS